MDLKFYTANMINPETDKGAVDIANAPMYDNAVAPKNGFLSYHKSSALSVPMAKTVLQAMKNKHVICFSEITLSGLRRENPADNSKINVANMKPHEVEHCDLINLGRISAPLRTEIVDILLKHADTAERRQMLNNVTADRFLINYIKKYPSSVDVLHEHDRFKHMKAILFPTGTDSITEFMVAFYGAKQEDISVKMLGIAKGVELKIPEKYIIPSDNMLHALTDKNEPANLVM